MAAIQRAARGRHHQIILDCVQETGEGFDGLTAVALTLIGRRLESAYEKVGEANIQLQGLLAPNEAGNDTAAFMGPIDATYRELALRIAQRVATLQTPAPPPPRAPELAQLRRPLDNVGEFNGSHADWPAFRDLFTALVINQAYDDLERFLLLHRACKGIAATTLKGYSPVAASFQQAWADLQGIYEDSHAVSQALIDRLVDLPLAKAESASELRRVIDTVTSTQRQLISLGHQCDHWSPLLMNLLARKLPKSTMGEWEQARRADQPPRLPELITFLESRARMRVFSAELATPAPPKGNQENRQSGGRHYQRGTDQPKPLQPHNNDNAGRWPEQCSKCKQPHRLYQCPAVTSAPTAYDRRQAIAGLRVCFNRLKPGHRAEQCSTGGCIRCNQKHNRILCPLNDRPPAAVAQVHHAGYKRSRHQ